MATLGQIEHWINSGLTKEQINKKLDYINKKMVYVRARGNIRKPRRSVRKRAPARRRAYTRRRTYRRRRAAPKSNTEVTPATKFAIAQLDPFEPQALGAKVPDSNTIPSIANADTDIVAVPAPSTAGYLTGLGFNPSYQTAVMAPAQGATSLDWTATTYATRSKASQFVASIEAYRPVAHALRLTSPLAPTSCTGFVHIGIDVESRYRATNFSAPDYAGSVSDMAGLPYYKRVTLASLTQSPLTVVNKWIDESAFRYDDPRSTYSFLSSASTPQTQTFNLQQSWGSIIVIVEGAPTGSSPLSVEHLLMTECQPQKSAFILGTQAAPYSPGLMSATSTMVSEGDFAHTEAEQDTFVGRGLNHLVNGLASGGRQIFNQYAPSVLNALGHRVGQTAMNMAVQGMMGLGGIAGINNNANRLALGV